MNKRLLLLLFITILLVSCRAIYWPTQKLQYKNAKILEKTTTDISDKTSNLLKGEVIDIETKEKLAFIQIELCRPIISYKILADSNGFFQFKNAIPGNYKFIFNYIGYNPLSIDSLNIENGKEIKIRAGLYPYMRIFVE